MGKRTPLYDEHVALGGKVVEFAGWEMPVRYSGIIAEHEAVRAKAGLFDVSHMGELWVTGPQAEAALNFLTCNDVTKLVDGKAQYSAILNKTGGVVDDIIIYRFNRERFLVCVNASNADADFAWLTANNTFDAKIDNASDAFGQVALQGPRAVQAMQKTLGMNDLEKIPYFHFAEREWNGTSLILARTGYTGEDGFEVFVPAGKTVELWRAILSTGESFGVIPCGLGARDSLRLEAALPLHGHELSPSISALSSGLGWIVKFGKGDFCGREPLAKQKEQGIETILVGFEVTDAGIARQDDRVTDESGRDVGVVTSGSKTPTVDRAIGMALVDHSVSQIGTPLKFVVRGKALSGRVVSKPFYRRSQE
jgi:aminomethyltransferase